MRYSAEKRRSDNYPDDVSSHNSLGMRCIAMGPDEDDEGAGRNRHDDCGAEHHVDDQENHQQGERGHRTLDEVVLPVAVKPSIDQPTLKHEAPHQPACVELAHHKSACIFSLRREIRHRCAWRVSVQS